MKQKHSRYPFLFLPLFLFFGGCESSSGSIPFLFLLGAGGAETSTAQATSAVSPSDSNGVPLPVSSSSIQTSDVATVPINVSVQEVPTSGNATFIGQIRPVTGDVEATDICGRQGAPSTPLCLDLTQIPVRVEVANGSSYTLVASTFPNASGLFILQLDNLPNNSYRVLIPTGNGLNYAYQDVAFVFNPTQTPRNVIQVSPLVSERLYYNAGPTVITGTVTTPGYSDASVTIPNGAIAGLVVQLKNAQGTTVATTQTDSSGAFSFSLSNLNNGNYSVSYVGSSVSQSGRPFFTNSDSLHFTFQGTNPSLPTQVNLGETSLPWLAATISSLQLSGSLSNAAVLGDTSTPFTIKLKNELGTVLDSVTVTGANPFQLAATGVPNGVYFVEISHPNFFTNTQSFLFTADPSGGTRNISLTSPVVGIPKPSNIVGYVRDAGGSHISGSVINFRPDSAQPPSQLAYLLTDPMIGNAIRAWILQALSAKAGKDCSNLANSGDSICSCALNPQASCLASVQGSAPWSYQTYGNKVYEVRPSDNQVFFTAAAGRWAYYISAPGYENYCGSNPSPCSSNPLSVALNGQEFQAGVISMVSATRRSQISGTIAIRDSGVSPTTIHTNHSGLFLVLLGNTDDNGNPVAHLTLSQNGSFQFGGSSWVVSLPNNLTSDAQRVGYVLQEFAQGRATQLSAANQIARANDATASVDIRNGSEYNFRQSSYQILVVDRLGNPSYLSPTTIQADNSSVARADYAGTPAILNLNGVGAHSPRGIIQGTVTDAISTSVVSSVAVTLGRFDSNGNFLADVRRDCSGPFNATSCTVSSNRSSGNDQLVEAVTTNGQGFYSIPFVSAGSYSLRIVSNGITTFFPVEIGASGGTTVANAPIITNPGRGNVTGTIRMPGGFSFTGTYVLEVVSPVSESIRPTTGVVPASLSSGVSTFSNAPQYSLFGLNAGRWKIRFISSGYKTVEGIVDVQADATTSFDIITFVPGSAPPAAVSGRAISALNNTNVCGLAVRLRPGVNVKSGAFAIDQNGATLPAVNTATDGSFAIPNVPPGNYTVEISGSQGRDRACTGSTLGYSATYGTVISAGASTPANQNFLVTPILPNNEVRVVLSWGSRPRDLDSHLQFGNSADGRDRVVWNQRNRLSGDAVLDFDVTSGFGPETITLKGSAWSQPVRLYSVYNWSNEATLGSSSATIRIYRGGIGEVRSYAVPSNHSNRWWEIFCLGNDQSVTDVGIGTCQASQFIRRAQN